METNELKDLWKDYNHKLDRVLELNNQVLMESRLKKAKTGMRKILIYRGIETVIFLLIVIGLWSYIIPNFALSAPVISALILNIFALIGLAGSIGQIVLIISLDYSQPILTIQKNIAKIQTHGIQLLKILLLSIPFYLTYIFLGAELLLGIDLFKYGNPAWFATNTFFSLFLCFPVYWLIKQLGENPTKHHWIMKIIEGFGIKHISSVINLLDEIESFENSHA